MVIWNDVLSYIKDYLALPSSFIEKTDEQIKRNVCRTALTTFSEYYPDTEFAKIDTNDPKYKHPNRPDWYVFYDKEELPILGIKEMYIEIGDLLMCGHPAFGNFSFEGLEMFATSALQFSLHRPSSPFYYTYKFYDPNYVHIMSDYNGISVVEYEREQPHDLRKIPAGYKRLFMDLALGETMVWIGTIRSHYGDGNIDTTFGTIPLNGENLKAEGKDMVDRCVQTLAENTIPPVFFDCGP